VLIGSNEQGVTKLTCPGRFCPELSCDRIGVWARKPASSAERCARFALTSPPKNESGRRHVNAHDRTMLEELRKSNKEAADQEHFYSFKNFPGRPPAMAIIWEPFGGRMYMSRARPQTRQVWWWSLGVPTIGSHAVGSARDAGQRAGVEALHNLTVDDISDALACIKRTPARWHELRKRVLHDARHSSSLLGAARELQSVVDQYGTLPLKPATGAFRRWLCPFARRKGLIDPVCTSCDPRGVQCTDPYVPGT